MAEQYRGSIKESSPAGTISPARCCSARETQTVTLATVTFIGYEEVAWGMMTAAPMVTIIPELILALLVQRYIVRGLTYGAVKG